MKNTISYTLRIDEEIHEKMKVVSKEQMRSLNSQLEYVMKEFIKKYEKEHGEIVVKEPIEMA